MAEGSTATVDRARELNLDLLSLDEAGFAKLYAERIAPILRAREADRASALTKYKTRTKIAIGSALIAALVMLFASQNFFPGIIAGLLVLALLQRRATAPVAALARSANHETLEVVAEALGCTYEHDGFDLDTHKRLLNLHLLPAFERAHLQDRFTGSHKGNAFAFCKAWLMSPSNDERPQPKFEGHLIRIAVPRAFTGTTILRRDAGVVDNWFEQSRVHALLERVYLGSGELEKAFETYATDQFEARYLADLGFVTRLLEIERRFNGRDLRCAFDGGDLLIAVESAAPPQAPDAEPSPSFFKRVMLYESYYKAGVSVDAGRAEEIEDALVADQKPAARTMKAPIDTIARARAIVADIAEIFRLIDNIMITR